MSLEGDALPIEDLHQLLERPCRGTRRRRRNRAWAKYSTAIQKMREDGVEMAAIRQRLQEEHKVSISYEALRRLVRKLEPKGPEAFVRLEVEPGAEAQVDFGYAGITLDQEGQRRKTWAFVMTLSHSRHQYVELVYNQKVETWLACTCTLWISSAERPSESCRTTSRQPSSSLRDEPLVQRAYRELADHYGFPHRPPAARRAAPQRQGRAGRRALLQAQLHGRP